jgi:hypothetical protein
MRHEVPYATRVHSLFLSPTGAVMLKSFTPLLLGAIIALSATLAGCGLAETGAVGAAAGSSQAEQVRQGKQTEARVQKQLDAAYQQAADQRRAAEAESQ